MICWYCHWGWPKPVADIYKRAAHDIEAVLDEAFAAGGYDAYPEPDSAETALKYGPGHVVWSDENFDLAESCLEYCGDPAYVDWPPAVMAIVRRSLRELADLPESVRECVPEDYDGEHPELFPPTAEVVESP